MHRCWLWDGRDAEYGNAGDENGNPREGEYRSWEQWTQGKARRGARTWTKGRTRSRELQPFYSAALWSAIPGPIERAVGVVLGAAEVGPLAFSLGAA